MSYIGNASDIEQEKNITEFHHNRSSASGTTTASNNNLLLGSSASKLRTSNTKMSDLWNAKRNNTLNNNNNNPKSDDSDSEISDSGNFLAKGAFLLTPSHELSMERGALICEKMNFKGCFSLTKTATGILFKFSSPEDYQAVFKKGFHKVTGARFYRKVFSIFNFYIFLYLIYNFNFLIQVAIPCRPQKTFTLFVLDVPEDVPVEDVRHSLYRFSSVVEVVRLVLHFPMDKSDVQNTGGTMASAGGSVTPKPQIPKLMKDEDSMIISTSSQKDTPPPPIRITLASVEEYNILIQNGLDFYGATFFPTEANLPQLATARIATRKGR